jgi:hypothetical protein
MNYNNEYNNVMHGEEECIVHDAIGMKELVAVHLLPSMSLSRSAVV